MRYTTILAVLAAAVVVVAKRRKKVEVTLESIPECAKPCIKKAIRDKTNCSDADYRCICRRDNFAKIQGTSVMCVVRECGYEVALGKSCFFSS